MRRRVSFLIPVSSEARTIAELVACVSASNIEKELIIVGDDSIDGTSGILDELASGCDGIRLIRQSKVRVPSRPTHPLFGCASVQE